MSTQISIRLSDDLLRMSKRYAKEHGYINVQEFFRDAAREKIFDDMEIRPEYIKKLQSKEANTFLSDEEAKEFIDDLRRRAGLNEKS